MGRLLNGIRDFATQIGTRRLLIMGGVAAALLVALAALSLGGSSGSKGFLFTDLDPASAQAITEKLKAQNVPFELSADGTSIMAPQDRLAELRMSFASENLGGKIGYEVLDQEQPFGISSSRAKLNETRAIEGELARSIESLDRVQKARVHIVMPERAMFSSETRKASAAVTVKSRGKLPGESVKAIRYLVSSSVPELAPESVSIVDQTGALLARAGQEAAGGDIEEFRQTTEARLRDQVEQLIEPIVGAGKVRAEVSVAVERGSTREETNRFDPDNQVIARQITVESGDSSRENVNGMRGVTVGAQLPENQNGLPVAPGGGDTRQSTRNEVSEDTTFDNSSTRSVIVREPGAITRLTVAVLVDGGQKALSPAETQRLTRMVENAVGFDAERGDSVVVDSIAFAKVEEEGGIASGLMDEVGMDRVFDILKILIIGAVILIAVRSLRGRRATDLPLLAGPAALPANVNGAAGEEQMLVAQTATAMVEDQALPLIGERESKSSFALLDQEIALAQVDGRIKVSALKRIGDAIGESPAESASVIRQWMNS